MHKLTTRKGFTLIELLVVIAIIGMLSSIVFASLNTARQKGRIASAQGTMRSAFTAAVLCMDDGAALTKPIVAGTSAVCANSASKFGTLPTGWTYSATMEEVTSDGTFSFSASGEASPNTKTITCTEGGCTTTP